jgi:hypothetical protein
LERKKIDAVALVLGTFATLVTMAMHPSGGRALRDGESLSRVGVAAVVSHSIAIAGLPLLLLGFWGLSRLLGWDSALVRLAFVTYAVSLVAVLNAAVMSGFVSTGTAMAIRPATPEDERVLQALGAYTFVINQGFAKVYVVASAAAMILWSLRAIRIRGWRGAGIFGVLAGGAAAGLVLTGTLPLNVHGFGMIVLLQSAWTVWIATRMATSESATTLQRDAS